MEVEKNLRIKFSHVQKLESALERTLGLDKNNSYSKSSNFGNDGDESSQTLN